MVEEEWGIEIERESEESNLEKKGRREEEAEETARGRKGSSPRRLVCSQPHGNSLKWTRFDRRIWRSGC